MKLKSGIIALVVFILGSSVSGNSLYAKSNNGAAEPGSVGYDLSFNSLDSSFNSFSGINASINSSFQVKRPPYRFVTFYTENGRRCSSPVSTRNHPHQVGLVRRMSIWGTCGPAPARVKDKQGRIVGIIIKSPKRFYFGPEVILYLDPRYLPSEKDLKNLINSIPK